MADERGSSIYAAYIKDQLTDQDARKSSIEQRGITVITTSGALVSLLFGLAAVLTGVQNYSLPNGAKDWLYAAMVAFVIAGIAGIATNLPLFYVGVNASSLSKGIEKRWDDHPIDAERRVAITQVEVLTRAKTLNTVKGFVLMSAIAAEVAAVIFLALAIRLILIHGGTAGATTPASNTSSGTIVRFVAPVNRAGDPLPSDQIKRRFYGRCERGSDVLRGPVFRCSTRHFVADPCWAAHRGKTPAATALCMPKPWSRTVYRIDTKRLAATSHKLSPHLLKAPWGVQLIDGSRCLATQGAHDRFQGRVVDFGCEGKPTRVLLRGIDQHGPQWKFDSAFWTGSSYVAGPTVSVGTAWFGGWRPGGQRAAALKRCKKRAHKHRWSHTRLKKCKKKARLLPV